MKRLRVGVLFGGQSAEHEVSLQSAKNVIEAIDPDKYEVVPIGITKSGQWLRLGSDHYLLNPGDPARIAIGDVGAEPTDLARLTEPTGADQGAVDVVFPVLHGPRGEDGTIQGLLEIAGLPYVGSGVLGSAVGMDKDVMKRLCREAGIPVAKFVTLTETSSTPWQEITEQLGETVFVKPANMGSSVGVAKVNDEAGFDAAVKEAFRYDRKVLVEAFIEGNELECAVLGNENPKTSKVGRVIPRHEFYSYEAKYIDPDGAELEAPAKIPDLIAAKVQLLAINVFKACDAAEMARVDFFQKGEQIWVNEINTIPGFTKISMYPMLWQASGVTYPELIDELIQLALARHQQAKPLVPEATDAS